MFERTPLDDAIKAFELADQDERRILRPFLLRKIPQLANRPRRQQDQLIPRLRKLLASPN
jgi:hypothetical protein